MNFKRTVAVGVVTVGLMCSGGYAQAAESAQSGNGSPFAGAFGGVVDLTVPGSVRNINSNSGAKPETGKAQAAGETESKPAGTAGSSATSATSGNGAVGASGGAGK